MKAGKVIWITVAFSWLVGGLTWQFFYSLCMLVLVYWFFYPLVASFAHLMFLVAPASVNCRKNGEKTGVNSGRKLLVVWDDLKKCYDLPALIARSIFPPYKHNTGVEGGAVRVIGSVLGQRGPFNFHSFMVLLSLIPPPPLLIFLKQW